MTWNGIINVASTRMKTTSRPKNLIRANAYPARLQNSRLPATTTTVTMSVFRNHRANGACCRTVGVVLPLEAARDQDRREMPGLAQGLERRDEHPDHRHDHDDRQREQHQVPRAEQEPAPLRVSSTHVFDRLEERVIAEFGGLRS